jgi:hypothetical protein
MELEAGKASESRSELVEAGNKLQQRQSGQSSCLERVGASSPVFRESDSWMNLRRRRRAVVQRRRGLKRWKGGRRRTSGVGMKNGSETGEGV